MDNKAGIESDLSFHSLQDQLNVIRHSDKTGIFRVYFGADGRLQLDHPNNWLVINPCVIGKNADTTVTISDILTLFGNDKSNNICSDIESGLTADKASIVKTTLVARQPAGQIALKIRLTAHHPENHPSCIDAEIINLGFKKELTFDHVNFNEDISVILSKAPVAIFKFFLVQSESSDEYVAKASNGWIANGAELYGSPLSDITSAQDMMQLALPEDQPLIKQALATTLNNKSLDVQFEYRILWPDKSLHWLLTKANIEYDAADKAISFSGVQYDITALKAEQHKLAFRAGHDSLTDLPNRALCIETLARTAAAANRYGRKFAVMKVDLDRFKFINDTLGPEKGDQCLIELAERYRESLRASEFISRNGGDEFVFIVDGLEQRQQAEIVAGKILSLTMMPITLDEQEYRVTASIGVACYPDDGQDANTLLKHAELAMRSAKESGKNIFQFYSTSLSTIHMAQLDLETQLQEALERNELKLLYQPKVGLQRDIITGVEALLRWTNGKLGSVSPLRFIPIAEENGLIVPIGQWVLETACRQAVQWQQMGLDLVPVAVNVSPRQFSEQNFYQNVVDALTHSGLEPHYLELELTESMMVYDVERTVDLLTSLKKLGVRVAIDDFGTGYSSLAQIKRFPVDTLKVDRSFVRNIHQDIEGQAIASAIFDMAKKLSLKVVAEGVETTDETLYLRSSSCDELQGYYFSKPISGGRIAVMLSNHLPRYQ